MEMNHKFPKTEKLKSNTLIDDLFKKGQSVTVFPMRLYFMPIDDAAVTTFKTGVSVPKRNFKLAVDRNRIKRLMREVFRKNKHLVYGKTKQQYALLFVFIGNKTPDYDFVENKLKACLNKFNLRTDTP